MVNYPTIDSPASRKSRTKEIIRKISEYSRNRYRQYEARKSEIAATAQTAEEYQREINRLAEELGI